jgi:DnaJ-class molecular chaperone
MVERKDMGGEEFKALAAAMWGQEARCSLCRGTGQINALTDQPYVFVASYADCPLCDGTGEAP